MKKRMLVSGLLILILCVLMVTFASAEVIDGDPDIAFQTGLQDETPSGGGTRSRGSGITASGTCGPQVSWTLDSDGLLTISGSGAMGDYSDNNIPWKDWLSDIREVVIQDGVTTVSSFAFNNCPNLSTVSLPEGITSIGAAAFQLTAITSLEIPDGVTVIAYGMFQQCQQLESVTIPASVTEITGSPFYNCSSLTDVYYKGTEEQWQAVNIHDNDEQMDKLNQAVIHYGDEVDEETISVSISPQEPVLGQPLTISWDFQEYEDCEFPSLEVMIFSGGMIKYLYPDLGNSLENKTGSITLTLMEGEFIAADLAFYINGGELIYGSTGRVPLSGEGNQPDPITVDVSYEVSTDHQITASYQVAGGSGGGYKSIKALWVRVDADGETYRLHSRQLTDTPVGQLTYLPPADGDYALLFDIFDLNDWQLDLIERPVTETVTVSGVSPQELGIEFYKELPTVLIPGAEFDLCWDVVGVSDEPKTDMRVVTNDGYVVYSGPQRGYSQNQKIRLNRNCDESTSLVISLTPKDGSVTGETVTREIPIVVPELGGFFRFGAYQQVTETARYYVHPDLQVDRNRLYSSNLYDFVPSGAEMLFTSQIQNYYTILDAFTSDPVFDIQLRKGNVDFNTGGYQDPSALTVRLSSMPEPGEAEFEVICTINGRNYSQTINMEFVLLDSLPTGLEIGQKLPLLFKVGDPFYDLKNVPVSFTDNWSVGESRETLLSTTNIIYNAVNFNTDTPVWSVPGVYRGEVRLIAVAENVMMHQTVDVVVTREDGTISADDYTPLGTVATVPADLTQIGSEAFAGTKLTEIDIPAGVEIAADAFDGTGLVAIYCHDQGTVDYALQHGFVAVVE